MATIDDSGKCTTNATSQKSISSAHGPHLIGNNVDQQIEGKMENGDECSCDNPQTQPTCPSNRLLERILQTLEELKQRVDENEQNSNMIKSSVKFLEYLCFHSDERCQYHDDYRSVMEEARLRSLTWVLDYKDKTGKKGKEVNAQRGRHNPKSKEYPTSEEDTNVMMEVSDEEDDVMIVDKETLTPSSPSVAGVERMRPPPSRSSTVGRSSAKGKSKNGPQAQMMSTKKPPLYPTHLRPNHIALGTQNLMVGRKLLISPSTEARPSKLVKREGLPNILNATKTRKPPTPTLNCSQRKGPPCISTANMKLAKDPLPNGMRTNFNPGIELHLSKAQLELCAYVFSPDHDPNEVIVKIAHLLATREELNCICPGRVVDEKIFNLVALKSSWRQRHMTSKTIWCLPPSFAEDVHQGFTLEDLIDTYGNEYMHPTPELQYIYVPINEGTHWYLMVLCLDQKVIYHLDSYLPIEMVEARRDTIKILGEVLAQVLSTECYIDAGLQQPHDFNGWDLLEGRGIPNCGCSDDSAVWVLGWLDMEYAFNPNLGGHLNHDEVRIKTATEIILGDCNERKKIVEARCSAHWRTLT